MKDSLHAVLQSSARRLRSAGLESAHLDAELLLRKSVACSSKEILLNPERTLTLQQIAQNEGFLRRRLQREPVAYILGTREFWSLEFKVTPDVLIPRPETEHLIEQVLQVVEGLPENRPIHLLDVGTGSGIIAISAAKEIARLKATAVDVSGEALQIAKENARSNGVEDRIEFRKSDLFRDLSPNETFDVIASNPPYIARSDIRNLMPDVKDFEPLQALDGGEDGLEIIRAMSRQVPKHLRPGGTLLIEFGEGQGPDIMKVFQEHIAFDGLRLLKDYSDKDRILIAERRDRG